MFTGRRLFVGCYLSLFSATQIAASTTATTSLATLALPLAAGFSIRFATGVSAPSKATLMNAKSADLAEGAKDLFARTPLIHSQPLSALVGKPVYLKLDALQASGSFKASANRFNQSIYPRNQSIASSMMGFS